LKGEAEMGKKKRKQEVKKERPTQQFKKINKNLYFIIGAISLILLIIISVWFFKTQRTLKKSATEAEIMAEYKNLPEKYQKRIDEVDDIRVKYERALMNLANNSASVRGLLNYYAQHRNIGFLIEVRKSGDYNTIFYLVKGVAPQINVVIVPKDLEQLLKANLQIEVGKYDQNGQAQIVMGNGQSIEHGGAYDHVNNVLFLYESGLEKQDKFYSYISFLHEIFHAYTTLEGLVHFNSMYETADAEIKAHRFIGQVLNELTDGWYFTAVKQKAADFQKNYPNAIESNLQIDSKVIVGDLEAKMQEKIGNAGHFQYLFDILDQWSKLKYGNSAQVEIFLKNFYLTSIGQNVK
jgi:hypothetical protein